jgi:hypothetical protein
MNHLQTLKDYNAWRRGDEALEQPDPKVIGEAIDWAIRVCEAAHDTTKAEGIVKRIAAAEILFDLFP